MTAPTRIAVIEDEAPIRRGVADVLRASGYEVAEAADGAVGLEEANRPGIDLVLLDLLLPRLDGLEVLRRLRRARPTLPVIILTARGTEDDRVRGLKMGADDYVVKPFSARELLARVEAVLRRSPGRPGEVAGARLGRAVIDFARREVRWSERERGELSETEAAILNYPGRQPQAGRVARGIAATRLGHRHRRIGDAHGGHAHRPAAGEAARPVRPQVAGSGADGAGARLHGKPGPGAAG